MLNSHPLQYFPDSWLIVALGSPGIHGPDVAPLDLKKHELKKQVICLTYIQCPVVK